MNRIMTIALLGAATIPLTAAGPITVEADAARGESIVIRPDVPFKKAEPAPPTAEQSAVLAFLAEEGVPASVIKTLVLDESHENYDGSRRYYRFVQKVGGLPVYEKYVKVAEGAEGFRIVGFDLAKRVQRVPGAARGAPSAAGALQRVLSSRYGRAASVPTPDASQSLSMAGPARTVRFAKTKDFYDAPMAELVLIEEADGGLTRAWKVETWGDAENDLAVTIVDTRGQIVSVQERTAKDTYRVYASHPGAGGAINRAGAGSGNNQSPSGWLSGTQYQFRLRGNNAYAYLDRDANNSPDSAGNSLSGTSFTTSANLSQSPTTTANRRAAIQSMFYHVNRIHDRLWTYGFREAQGNFQEANFGRGGSGSDSVNAEAQDGGGMNNANFATPGDGGNPRMQMYLWSYTNPNRDAALDADVIWHEYGHGLTWRMVGGMSGPIPGALGEGMADVLAIIEYDDDRVGEYSANSASGIRRARYGSYPYDLTDTQASSNGATVHSDGEIYAAAMWRTYRNLRSAGVGKTQIMQWIVDGLDNTPYRPHHIEMRDGLLAAMPSNRQCAVWNAFAEYGMGSGANLSIDSAGRLLGGTASFGVPSGC